MSRLNFLKKLFGGLVVGISFLSPLHSLIAQESKVSIQDSSQRTAPLLKEKYRVRPDQSDVDISIYLQENCQDEKERAIIYVPITRKIEDISLVRSVDRVSFPDKIIEKRLLEYHDIIFAHSHIITLSMVLDPKNQDHINALEHYGEYRLRRRMMNEIPSVGKNLDLNALVYTINNAKSKVIDEDLDLKLDCRIVILEKGLDPRVISYDVNKRLLDIIKNSDYRGDFGIYMRLPKVDKELQSYSSLLRRYLEEHADVFDMRDKPDPSFPEFAKQVNRHTNFIILDHGYIKTKKN